MRRAWSPLLLVAVAVIALGGCAIVADVPEAVSPTPTPSPTPSPTPTPTPTPTWTIAFGDECGNLLRSDQVDTLFAPGAELHSRRAMPWDIDVRALGGLACSWDLESTSMIDSHSL